MLLGFTRTVRAAGNTPVSGDADNHSALLGLIVTEYPAELEPPLIANVFAEGSAVPICHVNARVAGVGVSVD
jgi:hypothetical protein